MICYVLAMGKQHLGPHVVVGYGIKVFWPGLFITSPDHLVNYSLLNSSLCIASCEISLAFYLHPKKELKNLWERSTMSLIGGGHNFDFNAQILTSQFLWQNFIEIYQILGDFMIPSRV